MKVYRGNRLSDSAFILARALRCKVIKRHHQPVRGINVNWGSSDGVCSHDLTWINMPSSVKKAVDKAKTYRVFKERSVRTPDVLTKEEAIEWAKSHRVIARTLLRASSGRGMVVIPSGGNIPEAAMYVKYQPKRTEYRIHVIAGEVVHVQQKRKRRGVEVDTEIRSHDRGWVFAKPVGPVPDDVLTQSILAVDSLDLDFGGVDTIWSDKQQLAYVLEVNTAPGLSPTTAEIYATCIHKLILDIEENDA